jgi:serine/threonine protein kinase
MKQFKIHEKLRKGAFGKVYCAENIQTNQMVSLKLINVSKLKEEILLNQTRFDFESEVEILKKVHHPSIVQYFGHFDHFISEENHKFYIAMECVDEGNLQVLINA